MRYFKQQHLLFYSLVLIILTAVSCNKTDNTASVKSADAIVINTGPKSVDGCGWLIKTTADDSIYSVTNLNSQYYVDSLKVHIIYHKLSTRYYCGDIAPALDPGVSQIQLSAITKR